MFNPEKEYGFAIDEGRNKFIFSPGEYCDVSPNNAVRENPQLVRALPENDPKEGMEIVFWAKKEAAREGKTPSVENWTYLSVWNRARGPAHVRKTEKKFSQG